MYQNLILILLQIYCVALPFAILNDVATTEIVTTRIEDLTALVKQDLLEKPAK